MNEKIEELKAQLEDVEKRIFMLEMKDHWSADDYETKNELNKLKINLENEINKV